MKPPPELDAALERLLLGTSSRVVDASTGVDPVARAAIDAARESLATLAFALPASAPPEALRPHIATALCRTARPTRRAAIVSDTPVERRSRW